jgi:hypothetical protein
MLCAALLRGHGEGDGSSTLFEAGAFVWSGPGCAGLGPFPVRAHSRIPFPEALQEDRNVTSILFSSREAKQQEGERMSGWSMSLGGD